MTLTQILLSLIVVLLLVICELLRRQTGVASGHGYRTWRRIVRDRCETARLLTGRLAVRLGFWTRGSTRWTR